MKWLYGILCLFFLIIFHEFGHFLAAKLFKVKVESFSVGFGPVLLHKTIKGTDWRLSLLPLGGYCGMKGEDEFRQAIEENLNSINAEPDSLYGVHPLKRAAIGFSGPFFNFIFAILAFTIINLVGYTYSTYSNQITVLESTADVKYPAYESGLKNGDKIIKINGKETNDFSDLMEQISIHPDEDIVVEVERNKEIYDFNIHTLMDKDKGTGKIGIMADTNSLITKETPKYNFFSGLGKGIKDTFEYINLTFKSFKILFKGVKLQNAVSGPARVTDMLGTTVQEGFKASFRIGIVSVMSLMGIISISLFIMNLLPIPVLDGGLILIAIIEAISHKKVKPKIQYYIQFIGLAFILLIFCVGLFGDISYFINRS